MDSSKRVVDAAKVKFVSSAPPALPQLLAGGKVDAIGQFMVGAPLVEKAAAGKKAVLLPYGDHLPDLYGNSLMTSTKLADEKPELDLDRADALEGLAGVHPSSSA